MNSPVLIVNSCYNPGPGWAMCFAARATEIRQKAAAIPVRFVLVDDGSSSDLSEDIAYIESKVIDFEFLQYATNRGKGYALREGVKQYPSEYTVYTDIDFPYESDDYVEIIQRLVDDEADLVMGRRDKAYFKKIGFQRRMVSRMLIWMNRHLLRLPHPDTQCGIKGMNKKGREVFLEVGRNGFLFEVEFAQMAAKRLRVATELVHLRKDTTLRKLSMTLLWKLLLEYIGLKKK